MISNEIDIEMAKVQGYDIIRRDWSTNGRFGGGVCFYIRSNISYSVRTDLDSQLLEIISIEIRKHNSKPFVITSWYSPPNSPHELFAHVNTLLGKLDSENVEHFLLGDLNCDMQSKDNANVKALLNITDIYGLEQLINEPTRITPTTSTLIDLIFTNRAENVYCSGAVRHYLSETSISIRPL